VDLRHRRLRCSFSELVLLPHSRVGHYDPGHGRRNELSPSYDGAGQAVLGIQGVRLSEEEKVIETIYVKSAPAPLPVELSQIGQGSTLYTYFGPWGSLL